MADFQDLSSLIDRAEGQRKWLRENHPECGHEQKHLNEGSVERAYWHYGYMVALRDALKFLGVEPAS